jgi:hypothetical protein
MKMRNITCTQAALGITLLACESTPAGNSAKFAAAWTDLPALESVVVVTNATADT